MFRLRSTFLCCTILLSFVPSSSRAQDSLRDEQKKAYAKQFQAQGGRASQAEVRTLLDAQERRMTVPADRTRFRSFLERSPAFRAMAANQTPELGYLLAWNELALQATALDHFNSNPGSPPPTFAEQFGPTRSSRALAIVHLAMFEAIQTISRKFQSYRSLRTSILGELGLPADAVTPERVSRNRAVIEAAYTTLVALYPNKRSLFDNARDLQLPQLGNPTDEPVVLGAAVGEAAAKAVLALRCKDGVCFDKSELPDLTSLDFDSKNPQTWHTDPISRLTVALGGNWARVTPFVIRSGDAFRSVLRDPTGIDGEPARRIPAAEFIRDYKEVKRLGGDPNVPASGARWPTATDRTGAAKPDDPMPADASNQTFVGIFWGYDGTALLCAPPRLYNMIATSVALKEKPIDNAEDMAAYLAVVNVAMADAAIAAWDGKYHYLYPRPVTAIRSFKADDTPEGAKNPRWTPLGAPVTNGVAENRNLTPPFPAYPSGHAVFGAALFQSMTRFYKLKDAAFPAEGVAFKFVSDEYNGLNRSPGAAAPRKRIEAEFKSFAEASLHNAESRIFLGIHWRFDAVDGMKLGKAVADDVFGKFIVPSR